MGKKGKNEFWDQFYVFPSFFPHFSHVRGEVVSLLGKIAIRSMKQPALSRTGAKFGWGYLSWSLIWVVHTFGSFAKDVTEVPIYPRSCCRARFGRDH
eukprot:2679899-Amphidinium_carterae.1